MRDFENKALNDTYHCLLEWTGCHWRSDKRGAIAEDQPDILERLGLAGEEWMQMLRGFHGRFRRAAGRPTTRTQEADSRGDGGSGGSVRGGNFWGRTRPRPTWKKLPTIRSCLSFPDATGAASSRGAD
ncbi:MAG: hypothetical protein NT069_33300 [Planctomycetota bacterium]|nr:hypothetical protein [Planctomycetota bacterium]